MLNQLRSSSNRGLWPRHLQCTGVCERAALPPSPPHVGTRCGIAGADTGRAEQVHQQAQELASATGLKAPEYREKADRIKSELQEMQQNHDAFIGSLNTDQRTEMKGRIRKIEQLRSAVNSRVAEIDKDLRSPAPDSKRVAGSGKQLQKVIEDWQKQYKGIGEEMGIEG